MKDAWETNIDPPQKPYYYQEQNKTAIPEIIQPPLYNHSFEIISGTAHPFGLLCHRSSQMNVIQ